MINKDSTLVSIIIPVYNVESYISKCIESVFCQTYKKIEVIVVDDRGTDSSMNKVYNYKDKSPFDIKIITHEKNKGLSAARNSGIKVAAGDYIFFLDSDDTLPFNAIEKLILQAEKYNADIVMGNFKIIGASWNYRLKNNGHLNSNNKIFIDYLKNRWFVMACNKLIKKSFLIKNKIEFKIDLLHEDTLFSFKLASLAKSIVCIKEYTYNYLIRNNSITTNKSYKNFDDLLYIYKTNFDIIKKRNLESKEKKVVSEYLVKCVFYFSRELYKQKMISDREVNNLNERIMEFYQEQKLTYNDLSFKEMIKSKILTSSDVLKKIFFKVI